MIFELSRAIVVLLKKGGKRMGDFLLIHTFIVTISAAAVC